MIVYLVLYDPDNDTKHSFPFWEYQASPLSSQGYNSSLYTKGSLEQFHKSLYRSCSRLNIHVGEVKRLYFMYANGVSSSYIRIEHIDQGGFNYYTISAAVTDDPEGEPVLSGTLLEYTTDVTNLVSSIEAVNRGAGVRHFDDPTCQSRGTQLYVYDVGPSLTVRQSYANVLTYDKNQFCIGEAQIGGIVSNPRTVYTDPQYVVRISTDRAVHQMFEVTTGFDPLSEGGYSDEEFPDGSFDDESDPMDFADGPTISPVDTGFLTLYNPTVGEVRDLAAYMWSDAFSLNSFKKLFADPMDAILGLSIVPVQPPQGIRRTVKVGNLPIEGVTMVSVPSQIVHVNCGTLNLQEYWGSALDYAPNSRITLYLPYIGFRQLDIDEIMKKPITIEYHVDILTGACVAEIMTRTSDGVNMIAYSFDGNCAVQVPVTGADYSNMLSMTVKSVGTMVGAAATGGASAGVQAAAVAGGLTNTVNGVMNSKPTIQHSGNMAGGSGQLGQQRPYFILERPRQSLPEGYQQIEGYPANITRQLGTLTGFTQVDNLHLENINATDSELAEIESLLKSGVIL